MTFARDLVAASFSLLLCQLPPIFIFDVSDLVAKEIKHEKKDFLEEHFYENEFSY